MQPLEMVGWREHWLAVGVWCSLRHFSSTEECSALTHWGQNKQSVKDWHKEKLNLDQHGPFSWHISYFALAKGNGPIALLWSGPGCVLVTGAPLEHRDTKQTNVSPSLPSLSPHKKVCGSQDFCSRAKMKKFHNFFSSFGSVILIMLKSWTKLLEKKEGRRKR